MSRKKYLFAGILIIVAILSNFFIWRFIGHEDAEDKEVSLVVEAKSDTLDEYQLFYGTKDVFDEGQSGKDAVETIGSIEKIKFSVKADSKYFRLDFGSWPANIEIHRIYFEADGKQYDISPDKLENSIRLHGIYSVSKENDILYLNTSENDPYLVFSAESPELIRDLQKELDKKAAATRILLCIAIDVTALIVLFNIRCIGELKENLTRDRKLIWNLAKSDFKTRFAGSYFGIIWAFIQPVVITLVYWLALEIGLRSGQMLNYPFVLWLLCGLVPWFFFSEALGSGTNALTEYSYLVKKVVFKIDILPIVKVVSAIFVHLFFVALIVIVHMLYRFYPDWYTLQLIYYIICMFACVLSLVYITSAVVVFFKDLNQIIGIILQIGVWATPILWDASNLPAGLEMVMRLNPVYYVVNGFRDALLAKVWFWERPVWTVGFWCMVVILYIIGRNIFRRLQVHFADVL